MSKYNRPITCTNYFGRHLLQLDTHSLMLKGLSKVSNTHCNSWATGCWFVFKGALGFTGRVGVSPQEGTVTLFPAIKTSSLSCRKLSPDHSGSITHTLVFAGDNIIAAHGATFGTMYLCASHSIQSHDPVYPVFLPDHRTTEIVGWITL